MSKAEGRKAFRFFVGAILVAKPFHLSDTSSCQRSTPDRIAACFILASFDASGNRLRAASSMYAASQTVNSCSDARSTSRVNAMAAAS